METYIQTTRKQNRQFYKKSLLLNLKKRIEKNQQDSRQQKKH
jgi:hypothetical protein